MTDGDADVGAGEGLDDGDEVTDGGSGKSNVFIRRRSGFVERGTAAVKSEFATSSGDAVAFCSKRRATAPLT